MSITISKTHILERGKKKEIRRDMKTFHALRGIWKGKKMSDPVKWQRSMRRDVAR